MPFEYLSCYRKRAAGVLAALSIIRSPSNTRGEEFSSTDFAQGDR